VRSYEYRGLKAQAWDLLRGDYSTWPDRPFYLEAVRRYGEPALDVGCGTGRLVLDYLAQGVDCDGVDNSPEMLAVAEAKARELGVTAELYRQEMQALELPRRYGTIFVPSSSFLLLTDADDAREAMRRFFDHLRSGGALVMPFMVLWPGRPPEGDAWTDWRVSEAKRPEDGRIIRRHERFRFDMAAQLEHTEERYEVVDEAGNVVAEEQHARSPATRWYTQEQSLRLYVDAGFGDVRASSGFTFEPATPNDRIWTVIGRRP
jgi:ubiquinone/menaquinone biosynthesis C-methylase UbiE